MLTSSGNTENIFILIPLLNHLYVLSRFSRIRFFQTLWTVARQPLLFMGFSKQEYWSGLPFPSPSLSVETSILNLIFKTIFFSQRGCTIPGSTVIPGQCMEWTEQAPIQLLVLKIHLISQESVLLRIMVAKAFKFN